MVRVTDEGPTSHGLLEPGLQRFYEEAEADGAVLVFVHSRPEA